jgi:catechol-2,3-dioxygenase
VKAELRHIAIWTDRPAELSAFYVDVFGLQVLQPLTSAPASGTWAILTDGHMRLALINPGLRSQANGLHHVAFAATDKDRAIILRKLAALGIRPEPSSNPYAEDRVRDIDGNIIDVSGEKLQLRLGVKLGQTKSGTVV